MKVFLVNLIHKQDRYLHMAGELRRCGVEYERIPAVYGKDLAETELARSFSAFHSYCACGRKLTLGEIGCALSHLSVYRRMIEENIAVATVLEDDILLEECFNERCIDICSRMDLGKPQVVVLSAYKFDGGNEIGIVRNKWAMCTDGYIITLPAAKKIYRHNFPVVTVADDWHRWNWMAGIETYTCWPPIVRQDNARFGTDVNASTRKKFTGCGRLLHKMVRGSQFAMDLIVSVWKYGIRDRRKINRY